MRFIAYSGGADSTALGIIMKQRRIPFELVMADTGAELPETYHTAIRVAKHLEARLRVVCNGTFYQRLNEYGFLLPDGLRRWCTRALKMVPQEKIYANSDTEMVSVGIRADEAHRMAENRNSWPQDRPLVDAGYGKKEVLELCRKYDLLNPVYDTGRSSCSCFCCPFQRKGDWLWLLKQHPDLYALAEEWEGYSDGFTWSRSWSLTQLREADEAQLALWHDPVDTACAICSW